MIKLKLFILFFIVLKQLLIFNKFSVHICLFVITTVFIGFWWFIHQHVFSLNCCAMTELSELEL